MPTYTARLRDRASGKVVFRDIQARSEAEAGLMLAEESQWAIVEGIVPDFQEKPPAAAPPFPARPRATGPSIAALPARAVDLSPAQLARLIRTQVALGVAISWFVLLGLLVVILVGGVVLIGGLDAAFDAVTR